ncbi:MAG: hypothetical protein AAB541_03060, partial [Patescibacteria group bacterium]
MALHHKIKPHHHFAIWVLVGLAVIISGLAYTTASIDKASAEPGPSQKTEKFFGFDESDNGDDWTMPEACKNQGEQERMQQLSNEMQSLSGQMDALNQQDSSLSDEQRLVNQQKIQQLQQKMTQLQAESEELSKSFQSGPSADCKAAMVNQATGMMQNMLVKMNNRFPSTLAKVEAAVAKIEKVLPELSSAGLSADQVNKVKADIASIKVQLGILRSFFNKMKVSMQQFINEARANPAAAFEKMQNGSLGMDDAGADQAANAADAMVDAF